MTANTVPAKYLYLLACFVLTMLHGSVSWAQDQNEGTYPYANVGSVTTSPANRQASSSGWFGRAKFIRSHWVRLQPNGDLVGRIALLEPDSGAVGAESLSVSIYRKGELEGEARTDENGDFVVAGLSPGVYALVARGSEGFVAYGLTLVPSLREAKSDHIRLAQAIDIGETLNLTTAAVPPTFNQLRQILEQNFSRIRSSFVPPGEFTALLEEAEQAADALGEQQPTKIQSQYGIDDLATKKTDAKETRAATSVNVHPVILEQGERGWTMRGRLYGIDPESGRSVNIEAENTTVFLIQDDKRIATTRVDDEGVFDFIGIDEGVYSLIAIGESGFGAVSFRAVRPDEQARQRDDLIRMVQLPQLGPVPGGVGAFPFAMALIDDPESIRQAVMDPNAGMAEQIQGPTTAGQIAGATPIQPGQFPPSTSSFPPTSTTSGGFGGGGGGFPLGAALGAAAIATAIPLSVNRRNDTPRLISPFSPGLQAEP